MPGALASAPCVFLFRRNHAPYVSLRANLRVDCKTIGSTNPAFATLDYTPKMMLSPQRRASFSVSGVMLILRH